jgi:transcription antitermination factor NusG
MPLRRRSVGRSRQAAFVCADTLRAAQKPGIICSTDVRPTCASSGPIRRGGRNRASDLLETMTFMPVLPRETFVFPNNLFDEDDDGPGDERRWWALHTRPRSEKALARQLLKHDVSFFLPVHERRRRLQRRLIRSHVPLFPGYLFLRGSDDARVAAFATNLLVGCLHVEDQEQLHSDLGRIHRLIESGVSMLPEERLQPGMPAEITRGPLAGQRGTVIRRGAGKLLKFVVEVNFMQRGASIEVDASMIQPI